MADVARGHGGDGGSQDPNRNSNRIPSICESSQAKRKRGRGRNVKLFKKSEQNNGDPLPINFTAQARQYKFTGPHAQDFIRFISNTIASVVPMHFTSWQSVPPEYKKSVYPVLFDYFNLNMYKDGDADQWAGIELGIIAECQSRYSSRKNKLHEHFQAVGGTKDVDRAKSCPPENYDSQKWVDLIDTLFTDPAYI
ncbi:hypothetical protein HanIR_Chr11g0522121 [Helianthus annuus]|nr:hypothetical protein HanIR_Chr11g0522121 [Helianthus annuus]